MTHKKTHVAPPIGSVFQHRYKGKVYRMTVVAAGAGIAYKVEDMGVFNSPTAAAKAVVGDQFINGRKFWKMDVRPEMEQ